MPDPIIYPFVATGHGDVVNAIQAIQAAQADAARAMAAVAAAADRVGAAMERSARRGASAEERAAAAAVREANRSGREQEKAHARAAAAAEKAADRAAKATKRSEEARWREVERASAKIVREYEKDAAAAERAADKTARAWGRAQAANSSGLANGLRGLAGSAGNAIVGLAGSALQTGGELVGGAVRESIQTQTIANRVSINARMAGQEGVDPTQLRKEFERTAMATPGQSAGDIGKATQAYVDLTGDLDTARSSMATFATVASATGASVEDVATAAASLGSKFDVKKVDDMQKVFASLGQQGKGGAMTMKDLAAQFQKLASAGAAFNIGKGPEAVARLGGLVQIARQGTRSPQQAGTAVENVFAGLTSKGKQLRAAGVNIYDKKTGGKRDIDEILAETVSKVGGSDLSKKNEGLLKIFGRQGVRAVNPLIAAYTDAAAGKTGKEAQQAGYEAVLAALKKATEAASDFGEVQRDAAQAQEDAGAKLTCAWEALKAAAGERLAPMLAELAGRLAGDGAALDLFVGAIGLAADGLEAFAHFLQDKGLISGGSHAEQAAAAAAKEEGLTKQMAALGGEKGEKVSKLSAGDQHRYNQLNAKMLTAREVKEREQAAASQEGAEVAAIHKAQPGLDKDRQTQDAYRRLGGKPLARLLAGKDNGAAGDFVAGIFGETREQRAVRHAGDETEQAPRASGAGSADTAAGAAAMKAAADAQMAAAKETSAAAKAMAAAAPGSVTGAPTRPVLPK